MHPRLHAYKLCKWPPLRNTDSKGVSGCQVSLVRSEKVPTVCRKSSSSVSEAPLAPIKSSHTRDYTSVP